MAVLIGMSAEVKGRNFELAREKVSIGRTATNLIVLEHPSVSGRHCAIAHVNNRYILTDSGSTNGTRVNQQEIKEIQLKPKDLVQIGSLEFMFDNEVGEAAPAPSMVKAEVEEMQGPATAPVTFSSISPFGSRSSRSSRTWVTLMILVGVLAVLAMVALLFMLFAR
ncbi:MAG: FHA domain-containing protein [Kiritimatiellae bacterium]|nr:FHA domain-containing protein [Kiritimatiellia bacterium]